MAALQEENSGIPTLEGVVDAAGNEMRGVFTGEAATGWFMANMEGIDSIKLAQVPATAAQQQRRGRRGGGRGGVGGKKWALWKAEREREGGREGGDVCLCLCCRAFLLQTL